MVFNFFVTTGSVPMSRGLSAERRREKRYRRITVFKPSFGSNMKRILCLLLFTSTYVCADTIDHYMNIVNGIPQMEMKADAQSQAWARSAHTVLTLTCDGIADALILANENAKQQGRPLFCMADSAQLSPEMLDNLIQQTYRSLPNPQSEKDKMTVSQVALLGMQKQYPCAQGPGPAISTNTPAPLPLWGEK